MTTRQVLASIIATATVSGGLIIGFQKPEKLTYDEYQTLIRVYNYEIQRQGGNVVLGDPNYPVTDSSLIPKLNAKFLQRPQDINVNIAGQTLTPAEYKLLRSGLFKKAEQKSFFEKLFNN